MPSVWPVFGFIFGTRDLRRNLRIWWRVCTTSNDVIFTSKVPSCQVAIYWILKVRFFLSIMTSPIFFSKVRFITDSDRSDISKEPIKSDYFCKNAKKRNSVTTGTKCQVHYSWMCVSNTQNSDLDYLPFDGDKMLITKWWIYCIDGDIIEILNNGLIIDVYINRM